ncbi:MAG: response regulator transcription factor [Chloroflexi bacterium]|nr:response regulator transcription factor [Chloroflexota bacterium]
MRVLLVDDHNLFLESLQNLLTAHDFQVVGTAADGFVALAQARTLHPDLILMDLAMPRCDGLAATRLIKAEMPEMQIVMLTASEADAHLFEAIKSGATGYLLKSLRAPEFIQRLHALEQGEPPLSPGFAAKLMRELARHSETPTATDRAPTKSLSARQTQVLTLVAQGQTYAQVAQALHLSEATVRYHMAEILERLHLDNRAQVIAYAARLGWDRRVQT